MALEIICEALPNWQRRWGCLILLCLLLRGRFRESRYEYTPRRRETFVLVQAEEQLFWQSGPLVHRQSVLLVRRQNENRDRLEVVAGVVLLFPRTAVS